LSFFAALRFSIRLEKMESNASVVAAAASSGSLLRVVSAAALSKFGPAVLLLESGSSRAGFSCAREARADDDEDLADFFSPLSFLLFTGDVAFCICPLSFKRWLLACLQRPILDEEG